MPTRQDKRPPWTTLMLVLASLLLPSPLYCAPHNAPGGICMAHADSPAGPWKEYEANPLIAREWAPH